MSKSPSLQQRTSPLDADRWAAVATRQSASYIDTDAIMRNPMDWTPEWSRRGRGYTLYAALLERGRSGVQALVDRCCRHATAIVDGIGNLPNTDILWRPHLNQGLVRFLDAGPNASEASHEARTITVIDAINATLSS